MCGIVGVGPAIEPQQFAGVLNILSHRGPDGEGVWVDPEKQVTFGHRRLSIIDLSEAGSQPMHYEELVTVYNGEIYNYLEIRKELEYLGYRFTTHSDTEVLLKAYHCWGEKCFNKLNGMWAVAIYDRKKRSLLLVRDRYGEKPLYFYHRKDFFCFASEVKAIHGILGSDHPLNDEVVRGVCLGRNTWQGSEETYLRDVRVLKGGHYIKWENGRWSDQVRWYELKQAQVPSTFSDQADKFRELLVDSCMLRLRSDVPVGTCLSGGLDSGSIAAILNHKSFTRSSQFTHRSFCAAFPNTPIDEAAKAQRLARQLNCPIDIVNVEAPSINELLIAIESCDGPMHAPAFYPIWKLYQHIRKEGIVVTLDGQGPDEMLGGYRPLTQALQHAIRGMKPKYLRDVFNTYAAQGESTLVSSKRFAKDALMGTLKSEAKRTLKRALGLGEKPHWNHPFRDNPLDEELYNEFFVAPLPGILQQYDRCSMAHGVECRMPFMDYRIVDFVFSLPVESKVGGGYTKRVLRESVKGILPDETRLDKVKIGFNAPMVQWYAGPLRTWMLDMMNSTDYVTSNYFDGKLFLKEFEMHLKTGNQNWDDWWKFWGGVHFVTWQRQVRRDAGNPNIIHRF